MTTQQASETYQKTFTLWKASPGNKVTRVTSCKQQHFPSGLGYLEIYDKPKKLCNFTAGCKEADAGQELTVNRIPDTSPAASGGHHFH